MGYEFLGEKIVILYASVPGIDHDQSITGKSFVVESGETRPDSMGELIVVSSAFSCL